MTTFSYKILFFDGCEVIGEDGLDVSVEETDYPENDEGEARNQVYAYADEQADFLGADDYEVMLVDAY